MSALGLTLSSDRRVAIDGHVRLLLAWNASINLTAIREPEAIAIRHVVDSLTAVDLLLRRRIDRFVDLGSGGGFPGLPLAAALPANHALLIDSVGKKARFLATAVSATGLAERVSTASIRSEDLATDPRHRGRWPAVTARALAPLAELVELALPLLEPGGVLVAWKRGDLDDDAGLGGELAAAWRSLATIDPGARIVVEDAFGAHVGLEDLADHRLLVVERGIGPIDSRWPRDPAARRRAPC